MLLREASVVQLQHQHPQQAANVTSFARRSCFRVSGCVVRNSSTAAGGLGLDLTLSIPLLLLLLMCKLICVSRPPAVKQRIRAIKNIGKITKAMKMVAASKMRNAQTAVEHSRGIVEPFVRLFGDHPGVCVGRVVACFFGGGPHTETQRPAHTHTGDWRWIWYPMALGTKANASYLCVCVCWGLWVEGGRGSCSLGGR